MKNNQFPLLIFVALALSLSACQLLPGSEPRGSSSAAPSPTETQPLKVPADIPTETLTPSTSPTETATTTVTGAPALGLQVYAAPQIYALRMFSPTGGWAAADEHNRLLMTEDGGETWLDATPSDLLPLAEGNGSLGVRPFFLDAATAWFTPSTAGAGTLFHTADGGRTWLMSSVPFGRVAYFFLNQQEGWALEDLGAGAGSHYVALHRTNDGGETWSQVFAHEPGESKSLPESGTKNGVTFVDQSRGFIGGAIPMTDHFHFFVTEDGGVTWVQETDISLPGEFTGSFLDVSQPVFMDAATGILAVHAMSPGGSSLLVYRSEDAGRTWFYRGAVADGRDADFISVEQGWAVSDTDLFSTVDGGASWERLSATGLPADVTLHQVVFADQDHGWLLAYQDTGSATQRLLFRTLDGGQSWILLQP